MFFESVFTRDHQAVNVWEPILTWDKLGWSKKADAMNCVPWLFVITIVCGLWIVVLVIPQTTFHWHFCLFVIPDIKKNVQRNLRSTQTLEVCWIPFGKVNEVSKSFWPWYHSDNSPNSQVIVGNETQFNLNHFLAKKDWRHSMCVHTCVAQDLEILMKM